MAKTKVTVKFDFSKLVEGYPTRSIAAAVGQTVVKMSKEMIEVGASPVRGRRRFDAYKNPKKYPAGKKPSRPVNLNLTGEMLDALDYNIIDNKLLEIGILNATKEVNDRAKTHNTGSNPNIARRAFVPMGSMGETYAKRIIDAILEIYKKGLIDIINKSNK